MISKYLLSCNATFHKEKSKFSEIFSLKFSIIKTSFVLNLKKILSSNAIESTCRTDVLFFNIDAKCVFPEPLGPKMLTVRFIHFGQPAINSNASLLLEET